MRRNPIIPGDKKDRTGAAGIFRRASAQINARFSGLSREVLRIFDGIRTYGLNDARVMYGLTPDEVASVNQMLGEALERWLLEGENAYRFWYASFDSEAAQLGTAQASANLAALSASYAASRPLQQVLFSEAYKSRVAVAQIKSYEHWTGATSAVKSELSQIIGRAVVDGKNPKAVRREIAERLDVSKSRALQYAQTDITDTLRQARLAEADYATESMGIRTGLLWASALIPTTRPHHASRNGKVYTSDEVRQFYSDRSNLYRCRCSVTECLIDEDGKPILSDKLKRNMRAEREAWQKQNEAT